MARLIDGVLVKRMKVRPDDLGRSVEILRSDEDLFSKFGQVHVMTAYPGSIRGWNRHERQTDTIACPAGMVKLVLVDDRADSETHGETNEFLLGVHNALAVRIPPGVLHGFKTLGNTEAVVVNVTDVPVNHSDPDEEEIDPIINDIPYDWHSGAV